MAYDGHALCSEQRLFRSTGIASPGERTSLAFSICSCASITPSFTSCSFSDDARCFIISTRICKHSHTEIYFPFLYSRPSVRMCDVFTQSEAHLPPPFRRRCGCPRPASQRSSAQRASSTTPSPSDTCHPHPYRSLCLPCALLSVKTRSPKKVKTAKVF